MILLQKVMLPFINHALISMKYSSVKTAQKNVGTFHDQLIFK